MLTTERMNRIIVELQTGAKQLQPDTPEEAQFREQSRKELEQMKADGIGVDLPAE